MNLIYECTDCRYQTVFSADRLGGFVKDHFTAYPGHNVAVRCVQEAVPEDIPDLVKKHQVWIDSSRARIIALEKLVDMLVVGAVTRGECTVNQVRDLKYGLG